MHTIHLLHLQGVPILKQLQIEEGLLRSDSGNWCILNHGAPPAIVLGISGKPEQLVDLAAQKDRNVPMIRRFSGGGTVYIDENTFFSTLICNIEDISVPSCPCKIHNWAERLYKLAFHPLELELRENDYVRDNKKFGGNAQYLCKNRWLHHTSFLWDFHSAHMNILRIPSKAPQYRQTRPHDEFLCTLRQHIACKEEIGRLIQKSLREKFLIKECKLEEIEPILQKPHRKATAVCS